MVLCVNIGPCPYSRAVPECLKVEVERKGTIPARCLALPLVECNLVTWNRRQRIRLNCAGSRATLSAGRDRNWPFKSGSIASSTSPRSRSTHPRLCVASRVPTMLVPSSTCICRDDRAPHSVRRDLRHLLVTYFGVEIIILRPRG